MKLPERMAFPHRVAGFGVFVGPEFQLFSKLNP